MGLHESIKPRPDAPERELQQFTDNLSIIKNILEKHNVTYSLVGGLALKAILNQDAYPLRSNGTVVDFDALAFGPSNGSVKAALDELEPFTKQRLFPEVGIEPSRFGPPKQSAPSPLELLSSLRVSPDGKFFLTYRDIEQEIPAETMEIRPRSLNGIPFPCFPAKTTLFRYLTRGGMMKPKDDDKLKALDDHIVSHWDEEPGDDLYVPYLDFAEKIREKYPLPVGAYDLYWRIDKAIGGKISGSKGLVYKAIALLRE